ncbi:hypothetical protein L596_000569 [Steinernema carpocapsae]|uniref:Uncharacterized protein n=1 Tax=Steinernema carpocapsae TaxID=34508 RepID=A0A4U8UMQ8_STECR|nr:hypothetical protein L596_000569 [Steinernema carpocapsae]
MAKSTLPSGTLSSRLRKMRVSLLYVLQRVLVLFWSALKQLYVVGVTADCSMFASAPEDNQRCEDDRRHERQLDST